MIRHEIKIEGRELTSKLTKHYVAICKCGWQSGPCTDLKKAEDYGDEHVTYITSIERF